MSRDLDRAVLLTGVPFRLGLGLGAGEALMSDFLGRPRGRLTGEDMS